jgi:hypothetical protein
MGDTDKKTTDKQQGPRGKVEDKSKKPALQVEAEEDYEDGDIATPKRGPSDTDDEPL